jgi:RNA polymerase sigma-B factor
VGTTTAVYDESRGSTFAVRVLRSDTTAVVLVRGVVDFVSAPLLRAVLRELIDDSSSVVLDLTSVGLMDGHSVGMVVATHRLGRKRGCQIRLRGVQARVLRVLELTDAAKLVDPASTAPDQSDADNRTIETLLGARARHAHTDAERDGLRRLAIVEAYDLAAGLARRYRGRGESMDDLVQVAMVGLIKSVDGYDPERTSGFNAYAVPTIIGEIKRHFRDKGWQIRVPRRMQEIGAGLASARDILSQQLGRSPTVPEVAEHLGVTDVEVLEAIEAAQVYRAGSLSTPIGSDGDDTQTVVGDLIGGPDDGFELVEDRESLRGLVSDLPPREQRILAMRFYGNMTQSQIAERIGISQMHVSRLLTDALHRLRTGLTADR